jgi:predicted nucleotidyltransferase
LVRPASWAEGREPAPVPRDVWRARFPLSDDELREFCERWGIARLWLFGSILRDDYDEQSDIDVIVEVRPDGISGLLSFLRMEDELAGRVGRQVQVVEMQAVERSTNPYRKRHVLTTLQPLYAAG